MEAYKKEFFSAMWLYIVHLVAVDHLENEILPSRLL